MTLPELHHSALSPLNLNYYISTMSYNFFFFFFFRDLKFWNVLAQSFFFLIVGGANLSSLYPFVPVHLYNSGMKKYLIFWNFSHFWLKSPSNVIWSATQTCIYLGFHIFNMHVYKKQHTQDNNPIKRYIGASLPVLSIQPHRL